jgi:Competence protein J (ComJ)
MLLASFNLGLTYSFISVNNPQLLLNDWNDKHIRQGFSWRQGSVTFRMLNSCRDLIPTEIWKANDINLMPETVRAILVPFEVTTSEGVEFLDFSDEPRANLVSIPENKYVLIFETGFREQYREHPDYQGRLAVLLPIWCRFTFIPKGAQESVEAKILRTDPNLSPTYPLLMEADPA